MTQLISTLSLSLSAEVQTRGSVRRASGFVQIPISLIDLHDRGFERYRLIVIPAERF